MAYRFAHLVGHDTSGLRVTTISWQVDFSTLAGKNTELYSTSGTLQAESLNIMANCCMSSEVSLDNDLFMAFGATEGSQCTV